jgi:nucleoside-diphosphate-sugar epimerase
MSSETVLICGGAGYIGSALVFRLLKETDFKIKVFDNLSYGGDSIFSFFNFPERFEFVKGDVRTFDFDQLLKGVDYVVNLTALVGEPICKKFPKEAKEINFDSNIRLAKACEKNGIKRFVFTSTCSNYGLNETGEMIKEDGELQPISLYAETKVDSEKILINELPDLPCTVLRFATAYGMAARVRFDLLLHELIRDAWTKAKIYVFGAQSWRPMVHVDDIARGIMLVLSKSDSIKKKDVFNVGSNDQNFQKLQLAQMIAERFNVIIEETQSVKDPRNYKVNFDKVTNELGYKPIHSAKESIDQIADALEIGLIDDRILHESVNVKQN